MRFEDIGARIDNLKLVGKGWRSVVYRGSYEEKDLAFKVALSKEHEYAIWKEGRILERLRGMKGFPQLVLCGEDFIAYEFIRGIPFEKANLTRRERLMVYLQTLDMAYTLDRMGINRDEFQRLDKNLIVGEDGDVYLIDFERGSLKAKKPHNLPQFLQALVREGLMTREEAIGFGKRYRESAQEVYLEVRAVLESALSSSS